MADKEFNYEEDLAIDPHKLDEEWMLQPQLYFKYSSELAEAQRERDRAKENLDVVKARLDKEIRLNPEAFGIAKVTEIAISSAITLHKDKQNASNKFTEAEYKVNIMKAGTISFEHRKKALEGVVTLIVNQYTAGPKEPRVLPEGKRIISKQEVKDTEARRALSRRKS